RLLEKSDPGAAVSICGYQTRYRSGNVNCGCSSQQRLPKPNIVRGERTWSQPVHSLRSISCLDKAVRPGIRFEVFLVLGCDGVGFLERSDSDQEVSDLDHSPSPV